MTWPLVKLQDIFDIARGGSPRPIDDFITEDADGLNWISIKDASNSGKYISKTKLKIRKEGLSKSRLVQPGDFLLTNSMSFGRPYIMNTRGCIHDGWLVLSGDKNKINQDYFYHLLGSNLLHKKFSSLAAGAVVKNLNINLVKGVEVPLPALAEQQKIAAILDAADSLRQKDQQLVERYTALSQSLFLEMFGDPVTNPKKLKRITLGEVLKLKSGIFLPASQMVSTGKYPVFGGNGVNGYHDQFMFESKQIIIGRVGVYCGCVHVSPPNSWITDNALYVSEQDSRINFGYLAYSLSQANLNQFASKSAQPLISGARLYPTKILLPEIEHQNQYIKRLNLIEAQKQQAQLGLAKSEALFNSLLQRAFTGELTAKLVA